MLRSIVALVAGLFATMIVITGMEAISAVWLFPPPPGLDFRDPAAVNAFIKTMPAPAFAWILGAWLLGTFIGAGLAARIAERHRALLAVLIGLLVVIGTIVNATSIEHPRWVLALGVLLPIPLALLAARLFRKASPAPER